MSQSACIVHLLQSRFTNKPITMRIPALIVLLLASAVHGEVLSLNEANYAEATAGKNVFLKV